MSKLRSRSFNFSRRSAHTLVELMVVLSVSSALLAVAIGWIHQSMSFGSVVQSRRSHHQSLLRFASQFREDVHRGESIEMIDPSEVTVRLNANLSILYRVDDSHVTRVTRQNDEATSKEIFAFASGTTTIWRPEALPGTVGVVIERASGLAGGQAIETNEKGDANATKRPVELVLDVSVGRWHGDDSDNAAEGQP